MQAVLRCVYRVYASFCRLLTPDYHRLAAKEALEMYRLNLDNRPVEKSAGLFCPSEVRRGVFFSQTCSRTVSHAGIPSQPVLQEYSPQKRSECGEQSAFLPVLTEKGEIP